jgi:hypothetical protein
MKKTIVVLIGLLFSVGVFSQETKKQKMVLDNSKPLLTLEATCGKKVFAMPSARRKCRARSRVISSGLLILNC